jgi:hypothetical protein
LQADVEFFVPFYVAPGTDQSANDSFPGARAICAGIALTRAGGSSIGQDTAGQELAALRFNFRIPFTARMSQKFRRDDYELKTFFDAPVIQVQKRDMVRLGSKQPEWEKFDGWKSVVEKLCASTDGGELLNAPIGPLLLEKVSDSSGIKDIILKKSKRDEIKEEAAEVKEELEEAARLLKGL